LVAGKIPVNKHAPSAMIFKDHMRVPLSFFRKKIAASETLKRVIGDL
jgi:hypothetical protein